jgi:hypothetical protein
MSGYLLSGILLRKCQVMATIMSVTIRAIIGINFFMKGSLHTAGRMLPIVQPMLAA